MALPLIFLQTICPTWRPVVKLVKQACDRAGLRRSSSLTKLRVKPFEAMLTSYYMQHASSSVKLTPALDGPPPVTGMKVKQRKSVI